MNRIKIILVLWVLLHTPLIAKPTIVLIATGGAISGTHQDPLSGEFEVANVDVTVLLARSIEITRLATITTKKFDSIASQEITSDFLIKLSKTVTKELKNPDVDGIVITHGTDTLEETAYFLNLTVQSKKPIIITGALRAYLHPSSDTTQNLIDSIRVASSKKAWGKGVLVVANNTIISARGVQKVHTHGLHALGFRDSGFVGYVFNKAIDIYQTSTKKHTYHSEFDITKIDTLSTVDIAYVYAGSDITIPPKNLDGLILAGVGKGTISTQGIKTLDKFRRQGIQIVRSSRIQNGAILTQDSSEINDSKHQFITSNNLTPHKARLLLMLALTKQKDNKFIQHIFDTY